MKTNTEMLKISLNENTRLWNMYMNELLICPFRQEADIIYALYKLNREKERIRQEIKIKEIKGDPTM